MERVTDPRLQVRHRPQATRGRGAAVVLAFVGLFVTGAAAASADTNLFPGAARPALEEGVTAMKPGEALGIDVPSDGLAPGGVVRVKHVIANTAAVALRYSLTSESANPDGKGLRDVILVLISVCDEADATLLYSGPLGADSAGFGDRAIGAQAGDRILEPGERVALCFDVSMSDEAGNEYQGATTSTAWNVVSEQVAGNP